MVQQISVASMHIEIYFILQRLVIMTEEFVLATNREENNLGNTSYLATDGPRNDLLPYLISFQ